MSKPSELHSSAKIIIKPFSYRKTLIPNDEMMFPEYILYF